MVLSKIEIDTVGNLPQFIALIGKINNVISTSKEELFPAFLLEDANLLNTAITDVKARLDKAQTYMQEAASNKAFEAFGLSGDALRFKFLGLNHAVKVYNEKPTKLRLMRIMRHIMPVLDSLIDVLRGILQSFYPGASAVLDGIKEILDTFFNWLLDKERRLS